MRRLLVIVAVLACVPLVGCGDDGPEGAAPTTTATGDDAAWCEELDDQPTEALVEAVPAEHRRAAEIVVAFSTAVGGQLEADESGAPADGSTVTELAERVVGEVERLDAFAGDVQASCPDLGDEAVTGLRALTTTAALASEPRDEAYCAALAASFEDDEAGSDAFSALASIAPGSHRVALESIATLTGPSADGSTTDEADANDAIAGFMGLGLYAESVCGVEDAFAQMMLAGALLSMGEGSFGGTNVGSVGTEPPTADPAAANAAVPAGSDVVFETSVVDLDDDGDRKASVVAPVGWESDQFIGVTFEPPTGSPLGFGTSMRVGSDCDGVCEITDWEQRLRHEGNTVPNRTQGRTVTEDREPAGGDGVVLTTLDEDGATTVTVLRWDDTVDHYFSCEASLDAEDAALLDAFVAACEATRPNWFPVG